jgi:hypothetical protein
MDHNTEKGFNQPNFQLHIFRGWLIEGELCGVKCELLENLWRVVRELIERRERTDGETREN